MSDGYEYEPERKSSSWPWVLLGCGICAVVAVPLVAIIAAIAIPSLLVARRSSLETNAVGSCRAYCCAQAMYQRNDWEALGPGPGTKGVLEYARPYTWLCNQKDSNGHPIMLIDSAFAAAKGAAGTPKHGYLFDDLSTIAGSKIDWVNDYGLCGIPSVYGRTGYRSFMVCTNGTVFGQDQGTAGSFVKDYPADPSASTWIIAE